MYLKTYKKRRRCALDTLIDINSYPVQKTLKILLQDKTTKKNIIWATDAYSDHGTGYSDKDHISMMALCGLDSINLQSRTEKALEEQQLRTKKKAEVFTPVWICDQMNNYADEQWFGRTGVFNTENDDHTWTINKEKVIFPEKKNWKKYVDSRRLEITCGEAPYLVSRYDAATGELILPPLRRIGILDRKLRIVNENASDDEEWLKWTRRAFQSCYGYEYQGDSLLVARINFLLSFCDYYQERFDSEPGDSLLKIYANIISWNLWQMDGLKDAVPLGKPHEEYRQMSLFDIPDQNENEEEALPCRIYDWRKDNSLLFKTLKDNVRRGKAMKNKLFDFVIGNPPYNADFNNSGKNGNYAQPVYNDFMDAANEMAEKVELIHPARFLFNAGSTPKAWNEKMLNDMHFKVLHYEENASRVFPNTDIKGGVAITYHDNSSVFGAIGIFTPYEELNNILKKVFHDNMESISDIGVSGYAYHFTEVMHVEHPEVRSLQSKGHYYDLKSNIVEKLPMVFLEADPNDGHTYGIILGRVNNERVTRFIRREYLNDVINFD